MDGGVKKWVTVNGSSPGPSVRACDVACLSQIRTLTTATQITVKPGAVVTVTIVSDLVGESSTVHWRVAERRRWGELPAVLPAAFVLV